MRKARDIIIKKGKAVLKPGRYRRVIVEEGAALITEKYGVVVDELILRQGAKCTARKIKAKTLDFTVSGWLRKNAG